VLERCDRLLAAVVNNLVNRTRQPIRSYKMSQPQAGPAAAPELAATKQTHDKQPPKKVAVVSTARIERTAAGRAAETASAPELTFQSRWPDFPASPWLPCEIALNCDPSFN
jgi:hypothetical protein